MMEYYLEIGVQIPISIFSSHAALNTLSNLENVLDWPGDVYINGRKKSRRTTYGAYKTE
jgi:hypothetical protein